MPVLHRRSLLLVGCLVLALTSSPSAVRTATAWQSADVAVPAGEQDDQQDLDSAAVQPGVEPAQDAPSVAASFEHDAPGESVPEADAAAPQQERIRAIKFNAIAAGATTATELKAQWGHPLRVETTDGQSVLKYKVAPYRQVDVTIIDDTVSSVLIYLEEPLEPTVVAQQMRLDPFVPVPVPDESGKVLGQAYPERGVLFSFSDSKENPQVTHIQLEPISPELFVLRAEYDFDRRYVQNLEDLDSALKLNPQYARAYWWRAELLARVGKYRSALAASVKAVGLEPTSPRYRLTKARLLADTGNHEEALREVQAVLSTGDLSAEARAYAKNLLGTLIATGPSHQHREAMKHHLEAIQLAAALADERRFAVRRAAKEILIDAHQAVAVEISQGEFEKKEEVVPKWIERAGALAEETIAQEQGDPLHRLQVLRTQLAESAELDGTIDAHIAAENARQLADEMLEAQPDTLRKSSIQWELGRIMFEAMRVARLRGDAETALKYADSAITLFEQSAQQRQSTPEQKHLIASLYFLIGAIHAVHQQDHREAVVWYAKAEPLLRTPPPPSLLGQPDVHGERFVSMGVSFWEVGQHQKAITLTQEGLDILQRGVEDRRIGSPTLAIPYGNLAAMHRQLGNISQADKFASLAARLDVSSNPTQKR